MSRFTLRGNLSGLPSRSVFGFDRLSMRGWWMKGRSRSKGDEQHKRMPLVRFDFIFCLCSARIYNGWLTVATCTHNHNNSVARHSIRGGCFGGGCV